MLSFPQALDPVNLNSEGLSLSIEEQLSALTLSELQTPDSKSTVYLNGTAFKTDIFEITRESTKVFWLWFSDLPLRSLDFSTLPFKLLMNCHTLIIADQAKLAIQIKSGRYIESLLNPFWEGSNLLGVDGYF